VSFELSTILDFVDPGALLLLVAANATPVAAARLFGSRFDLPIDAIVARRGKQPLFGAHKTWRGLIAGVLACALIGALLPSGAWVGLGVGLLALGGDLASSFAKRRMQLQSGYSAPLLDQLPESLLPLLVFGDALALSGSAVLGTALAFTLLDLVISPWREKLAQST
jgi:hypothetical protein